MEPPPLHYLSSPPLRAEVEPPCCYTPGWRSIASNNPIFFNADREEPLLPALPVHQNMPDLCMQALPVNYLSEPSPATRIDGGVELPSDAVVALLFGWGGKGLFSGAEGHFSTIVAASVHADAGPPLPLPLKIAG